MLDQVVLGRFFRPPRADDFAAPHDRDAVAHRHHFRQLVRNNQDAVPFRGKPAQRLAASAATSCGVSTAVGSSRIRICAPRTKAFKISTRCCSPTERCEIFALRSTSIP